MTAKEELEEQFWPLVHKTDDCWLWQGKNLRSTKYGVIRIGTFSLMAHRVAYALTYGKIADDLLVCHKCDNPQCVRPDHLFLGTASDNMRDCVAKGRHPHIARKMNGQSNTHSLCSP